jgi:hypothetical protein
MEKRRRAQLRQMYGDLYAPAWLDERPAEGARESGQAPAPAPKRRRGRPASHPLPLNSGNIIDTGVEPAAQAAPAAEAPRATAPRPDVPTPALDVDCAGAFPAWRLAQYDALAAASGYPGDRTGFAGFVRLLPRAAVSRLIAALAF